MPKVISCSALHCGNKSSGAETLTFHRFPSDEKTCRIWLQRAGNDELPLLPADFLTKQRFLCRKHFESECYKPGSNSLRIGSVPTIFHPNVSPLSEEQVAEYPLKKKSRGKRKSGKRCTHSKICQNRETTVPQRVVYLVIQY